MKRTWAAVIVLVAFLLCIQHFGLERTKEKREEDRYTQIAGLRATRILPQYIASLFMGSFRAVAVDVLWVQLRRMREEEHRYFETVEIMDMISSLQPRNAEVWVYQSWDAAYNIANHVRSADDRWKWIRYALEKLLEGTRQMSDDAYLKFEIGRTLMHKATWHEGIFQEDYMTHLEGDLDLQEKLVKPLGRRTPDGALSCFELAIPWYEAALEDLRRLKEEQRWRYMSATSGTSAEDRDYLTTQLGLNIQPSSVDGNIYLCKFFNAFYRWRQKRNAEAAQWFRAAAAHARLIRKRYANSSPIFDDYAAMCDALAEAAARPAETREEKARLLETLTPVLRKAGTKDYFYLYKDISAIKRALGGDEFEFNDGLEHAWTVEFERLVEATLCPPGDVDAFLGYVREPEEPQAHHHEHGHDGEEAPKFPPHRVGFQVKKDGDVDLEVELWTFMPSGTGVMLQKVATRTLREKRWEEIEAVTHAAAHIIVIVKAADPAAAAAAKKPAYLLRWSLAEPVK